ncbi:MAG: glycoside hydrolase N-terminal domain-containing protein, partial [Verrucomicrobia bacterium]|nr:glycoside hydrolase N-terminal domain-containing protein [Verrucomicrobiota bacterium]
MNRPGTREVLTCAVLVAGVALGRTEPQTQDLKLWYDKPAAQWVEALPVGNGRLGAMVFGGVDQERLQLNEGTLWAGGPYDPSSPEALQAL